VSDAETAASAKYTVGDNAVIMLNGKTASLSAIVENNFVTMKIEDGAVTKLIAVNTDSTVTGEIRSITYGTNVLLTMADSDGTVFYFSVPISAPPTITRGSTVITIDRLVVGEEVTVTVKNLKVDTIVARSTGNTVTGVLTSITTTSGGTQWVVTTADGTETTLSIGDSVLVYSGSTQIQLADIDIGDTISAVIYGSTVSEINLISAVSSSVKVAGTVLTVDTAKKTVTILTSSDKLVYIDASATVSILNAGTGRTLSISGIDAGDSLVRRGIHGSQRVRRKSMS
jgi:hypothetical protein